MFERLKKLIFGNEQKTILDNIGDHTVSLNKELNDTIKLMRKLTTEIQKNQDVNQKLMNRIQETNVLRNRSKITEASPYYLMLKSIEAAWTYQSQVHVKLSHIPDISQINNQIKNSIKCLDLSSRYMMKSLEILKRNFSR